MMPLREEGCSLGKTVKVRNLVIGEGMPKICVPITGRCEEVILAAARAVLEVPADMAEWRADWYDRAGSRDEVSVILKKIRSILGDMPLLMTFRTKILIHIRGYVPMPYIPDI